METSVTYALDLVVRLIDTTTGYPVTERRVMFYEDDRPVTYVGKGEGVYISLNHKREDRLLRVCVKGYLEEKVKIQYAQLSSKYPEIFIELIPEIPVYGYTDILELKGNMPGILSVSAVSMTESKARAAAYQEKKQQLKLFDSSRLTERAYALIHRDPEFFEEFHVKSVKNRLILKLEEPLETICKPEELVSRIVRGRTDGSGNYFLRIRGDGRGTDYLVRYVVEGQTKFKRIVFDDPENRRL